LRTSLSKIHPTAADAAAADTEEEPFSAEQARPAGVGLDGFRGRAGSSPEPLVERDHERREEGGGESGGERARDDPEDDCDAECRNEQAQGLSKPGENRDGNRAPRKDRGLR
jgi:hypothetical protein